MAFWVLMVMPLNSPLLASNANGFVWELAWKG